nr:amidase domain-containing protein [Bacillus wiedmannii]
MFKKLLLSLMLLFLVIPCFNNVSSAEETVVKQPLDAYFYAYNEPSFNSQKSNGGNQFGPQKALGVKEKRADGWWKVVTYEGDKWINITGEQKKIEKPYITFAEPKFTSPKGNNNEPIAPQVVTVIDGQVDGWLKIKTNEGDKWIFPNSEAVKVDKYFYAYNEPSFTSEKAASGNQFAPQKSLVVKEKRTNGWWKVATYEGDKWVNLDGELKAFDKPFLVFYEPAFASQKGNMEVPYNPTTIRVVDGNTAGWLKVQTWEGDKWMYPGVAETTAVSKSFYTYNEPAFISSRGTQFGPQKFLAVLEKRADGWWKVVTYQGPKWINLDSEKPGNWSYNAEKRRWFEYDGNGNVVQKFGWQTVNGKKVFYSFEDSGLYTNKWYFIDDKPYEFDRYGYLVENSFDDTTLGELEADLLEYFKQNGIQYKVGTLEYEKYLINQLQEHEDAKLALHPKYTKILTYAAEYLHEKTKSEASQSKAVTARSATINKNDSFTMEHVSNKTVKQIKEEVDAEEAKILKPDNTKENSSETKTYQPVQKAAVQRAYYYYDPQAAVNYALQWALSRNPAYDDRSGAGGDCTNFVSQALYAGGMRMDMPGEISHLSPYVTDGGWFSKRIDLSVPSYRVSSSWINVEMFYRYWTPRSTNVTKTWSPMQVYYGSSPGDVLQYQYAGGGRKWHSLLVTGKNTSKRTIYITQHSGNRKNEDYANIDKDSQGDSQWIILKLTN